MNLKRFPYQRWSPRAHAPIGQWQFESD